MPAAVMVATATATSASGRSPGLSRLPATGGRWLAVAMTPEGIISGLFAGIIIGMIARILVPSMQPIGCIVTIIIGIIGAFLGLAIANWAGYGTDSWFLVFITQVFVATILVAITAALFRKSDTG